MLEGKKKEPYNDALWWRPMTNVPRNVLKPPPQNRGWLEQVVDASDPFPSPAHKKEGKGSGPPDYKKGAIVKQPLSF